jgi:hypothetical protein
MASIRTSDIGETDQRCLNICISLTYSGPLRSKYGERRSRARQTRCDRPNANTLSALRPLRSGLGACIHARFSVALRPRARLQSTRHRFAPAQRHGHQRNKPRTERRDPWDLRPTHCSRRQNGIIRSSVRRPDDMQHSHAGSHPHGQPPRRPASSGPRWFSGTPDTLGRLQHFAHHRDAIVF